jgi:hypothetical protein
MNMNNLAGSNKQNKINIVHKQTKNIAGHKSHMKPAAHVCFPEGTVVVAPCEDALAVEPEP